MVTTLVGKICWTMIARWVLFIRQTSWHRNGLKVCRAVKELRCVIIYEESLIFVKVLLLTTSFVFHCQDCDMPAALSSPDARPEAGVDQVDVMEFLGLKRAESVNKKLP